MERPKDEPGDEIVDRARLAAIRADLGQDFSRLFGYFLEDAGKSIAAIERAMASRCAVALVRPAHTLKGEALQFGAGRLGRLAEAIEHAARRAVEAQGFPDGIAGADGAVARLAPLFAETEALLRRAIAPPSPVRRAIGLGRRIVTTR